MKQNPKKPLNPGEARTSIRPTSDLLLFRKVWGLTGGIASGKTSAAEILKKMGCRIIDADAIAKTLLQKNSPVFSDILEKFGTTDRNKLREIIFKEPQLRKDLEFIMHPAIQLECQEKIKQYLRTDLELPILYEAALLIETGKTALLRGLIVIDCPREIRKKRLMDRDSISEELAEKMLNSQVSDALRKKEATHLIDNSKNRSHLKGQISTLVSTLSKN